MSSDSHVAGHEVAHRVAALWFPDWPLQAALLDGAVDTPGAGDAGAGTSAGVGSVPLALVQSHRVHVCNAAARAVGIRRGMRQRQAQAVCPELTVVEANPDRDGAVFATLVGALDEVASSVEILRPGLVIVDAGAAGRFHGGEEAAVEMLVDAAARRGVDSTVGVADEIATALIAARHPGGGMVVPPGASRDYLAPRAVRTLAAETSLGCGAELVAHFERLGLRTLGELAQLPLAQVVTRFGEAGRTCHAIARAAPDRRVAPDLPASDYAVGVTPEEPIARVDAAAFIARHLAARLHAALAAAGLVCTRLRVVAEFTDGQRLERVWRIRHALTEADTADRVRWQLDGWLSAARAATPAQATGDDWDGGENGIVTLLLDPVETARPGMDEALWGTKRTAEKAHRAIARVQSTLGIDRVLQPHVAGGRGVAERITFAPYGEQRDPAPAGAWPGRIPAPLPAVSSPDLRGPSTNHPAARIRLIDAAASPVRVTAEALLSSVPYALGWGKHRYRVVAWAGPWPVDTQWWTNSPQRVARLQVVGEEPTAQSGRQRAWLLLWENQQWRVEASYR